MPGPGMRTHFWALSVVLKMVPAAPLTIRQVDTDGHATDSTAAEAVGRVTLVQDLPLSVLRRATLPTTASQTVVVGHATAVPTLPPGSAGSFPIAQLAPPFVVRKIPAPL